jgi:hypothetical protein
MKSTFRRFLRSPAALKYSFIADRYGPQDQPPVAFRRGSSASVII